MEEHEHASTSEPIDLFLVAGSRVRKVKWQGDTFQELEDCAKKAFLGATGPVLFKTLRLGEHDLYLKHPKYPVYFEGWEVQHLQMGSIVQIRSQDFISAAASAQQDGPLYAAHKKGLRGQLASMLNPTDANAKKKPAQQEFMSWDERLNAWRKKTWKTLDDPTSSPVAMVIMVVMMIAIMYSTCIFIVSTLPLYYEEKEDYSSFWGISETVCILLFTLEILLRVITCPSKTAYFKDLMNVIDIVAVLPYYITRATAGFSISSMQVLRIFRLIRVFRLFKVSRSSIRLLALTMSQSAKPLYMLVFFTTIGMVIFSSLVYYVERGTYDTDIQAWKRAYMWECDVVLEVPPGEPLGRDYTVPSGVADHPDCFWLETIDDTHALFSCPILNRLKHGCRPIYEVTPFESIPATFWWCLATMTTVGYGDIVPISWLGRMLGMVVMLFGILVIALPITVIGSAFESSYRQLVEREKAKHSRLPHGAIDVGPPGHRTPSLSGRLQRDAARETNASGGGGVSPTRSRPT